MFKVEINNPKEFTSVIETTSKIVEEIKFTADSEGIRFSQLDKSHICFIKAEFSNNYFTDYVCDTPETFNVDSSEIVKVLKRGKTDDLLTITLDESNIILKFEGDTTRTFSVRLIDLEYDSPVMPTIDYKVTSKTLFKDFTDTVKDCELYSDKFYIKTKQDKFIVSCDGEFGAYNAEILTDDLNTDEVYKSVYSIPKVKDFFSVNVSKDLTLSMGEDIPLLLEQDNSFGLKVSYLIAPRIETE